MTNKTVAIFGVFDGVHDGHLHFIGEAKKQGNHLVAIVARDEVIKKLKGRLPQNNEVDRVNNLLKISDIDMVVLGDPKIGTYNILKEVKPSVVFLGYDQDSLFNNLSNVVKDSPLQGVEIIRGTPYEPDIFHSSILNKNN
jgi:FAD synthetase